MYDICKVTAMIDLFVLVINLVLQLGLSALLWIHTSAI